MVMSGLVPNAIVTMQCLNGGGYHGVSNHLLQIMSYGLAVWAAILTFCIRKYGAIGTYCTALRMPSTKALVFFLPCFLRICP